MTKPKTHSGCCSNLHRPKTPVKLAELPYPSNPKSDSTHNRLQNPEVGLIHIALADKHSKYKKLRKGWWFPIVDQTPMLDGSGDGVIRGWVQRCIMLDKKERAVTLNACSYKMLKRPAEMGPGEDPMPCAFSWLCSTKKPDGTNGGEASGWIPLECLKLKHEKSKAKVEADLLHWACCIKKYGAWGKSLSKGDSSTYFVRSVAELEAVVAELGGTADLAPYFRERHKGSVRKLLAAANGQQPLLKELIGIVPACSSGNRLTDYLPRAKDHKPSTHGGPGGYLNLSPNAKDTAPIAIDTFPSGHPFHRLSFKKSPQLLLSIFEVPHAKGHAKKKATGSKTSVGKVVWYYGYFDTLAGGIEERRYGWVPALAVKS